MAGHREPLRRLPATAVLDAAWTVMYDRAARLDELTARAGNRSSHVDDLTLSVWGPPEIEPFDELDEATEQAAVAEMAAFFAQWERQNPSAGGGD